MHYLCLFSTNVEVHAQFCGALKSAFMQISDILLMIFLQIQSLLSTSLINEVNTILEIGYDIILTYLTSFRHTPLWSISRLSRATFSAAFAFLLVSNEHYA